MSNGVVVECSVLLLLFQALTGFILVTTRDGKLVYISENVTEYLGHSMVGPSLSPCN